MRKFFNLRISDLLSFIGLFIIVISFFGCKKDVVETEKTETTSHLLSVPAIIEDFAVRNTYFNEDSIKEFKLNDDIFNNLGTGKDTITGENKMSIFKILSLQPIVKYELNEDFVMKMIVSWEPEKNKIIIDSIVNELLGSDPQIHELTIDKDTTNPCVYIDFFLLDKFGEVQIDYENQNLNDYLMYNSSLVEGFDQDEIELLPQRFSEYYGHKYVTSFTMGTHYSCQLKIAFIDDISGNEIEILNEVVTMLNKVLNENASWDDLKMNSVFLRHSTVSYIIGGAIPMSPALINVNDIATGLNYVDSLYKEAYLGILDYSYQSFSRIYPKYEFGN